MVSFSGVKAVKDPQVSVRGHMTRLAEDTLMIHGRDTDGCPVDRVSMGVLHRHDPGGRLKKPQTDVFLEDLDGKDSLRVELGVNHEGATFVTVINEDPDFPRGFGSPAEFSIQLSGPNGKARPFESEFGSNPTPFTRSGHFHAVHIHQEAGRVEVRGLDARGQEMPGAASALPLDSPGTLSQGPARADEVWNLT